MSYAIRKDGQGWRAVNGPDEVEPNETYSAAQPELEATPVMIEDAKIAMVQRYMDDAARALRYDNIKTACTYADEPSVPKFQIEGQALRSWRSQVWAACYAILADVQAGSRNMPSDEDMIADLPAFMPISAG